MARNRRIVYFRGTTRRKRGVLFYYKERAKVTEPQFFQTTNSQPAVSEGDSVEATNNESSSGIQVAQYSPALVTIEGEFSDFSDPILGTCSVGLYNLTNGKFQDENINLIGFAEGFVEGVAVTTVQYLVNVTQRTYFGLKCLSAVGSFTVQAGISVKVEYL